MEKTPSPHPLTKVETESSPESEGNCVWMGEIGILRHFLLPSCRCQYFSLFKPVIKQGQGNLGNGLQRKGEDELESRPVGDPLEEEGVCGEPFRILNIGFRYQVPKVLGGSSFLEFQEVGHESFCFSS